MNITIAGKRLISTYHHYIMKLKPENFISYPVDGYESRIITLEDIDILAQGGFAIANMKPYLTREKEYSTGFLFFEKSSKKPVGYIWLIRRNGNELSYRVRKTDTVISCVFVFKEYRGRNIANLMISKVIETLRAEGGTEVALGVRKANAAAIRAYEKCGFQITGEKTYSRILRKTFPYHII